tara:strand:- start:9139 stop:9849 length:711 start_codon:yes stop_codon:yes gene_type:complete
MNYRIRMLIAGIWAGIVTLLVFFISLVTWSRPFSAWLYARMLGGVGMRILGIKVRVEGKENLASEPAVLMVNHQSNLDAFFMGSMYPRNTIVLAKREMLKVPLFGIILLASGNILVDREDASGAKKAVTDATNAIKKRGRHLWIFPEGTRSKGKGLGEFKKGAFVMAIAAQAPIIPIVNQSMGHLLDPARKFLKSGTHHVKVLPAIPTKGLRFRDADRLLNEIRASFEKELEGFTI